MEIHISPYTPYQHEDPIDLLLHIAEGAALTDLEIENEAGWKMGTIKNWRQKSNKAGNTELRFISDLANVIARLLFYYEPMQVRAWLTLQHPQLEKETAIKLVKMGRTTIVHKIINRLDGAAFI